MLQQLDLCINNITFPSIESKCNSRCLSNHYGTSLLQYTITQIHKLMSISIITADKCGLCVLL